MISRRAAAPRSSASGSKDGATSLLSQYAAPDSPAPAATAAAPTCRRRPASVRIAIAADAHRAASTVDKSIAAKRRVQRTARPGILNRAEPPLRILGPRAASKTFCRSQQILQFKHSHLYSWNPSGGTASNTSAANCAALKATHVCAAAFNRGQHLLKPASQRCCATPASRRLRT